MRRRDTLYKEKKKEKLRIQKKDNKKDNKKGTNAPFLLSFSWLFLF